VSSFEKAHNSQTLPAAFAQIVMERPDKNIILVWLSQNEGQSEIGVSQHRLGHGSIDSPLDPLQNNVQHSPGAPRRSIDKMV